VAGAEPTYYWDTCLFLAWLKDEQRLTGEMDGVREIIERSKRKEVRIVTSVLTKVEVLSGRMPVGMDTLFSGLMKRIHPLSMDIKIAQVAHDLRDYYSNNRAQYGGKMLGTPDAVHLATAILYRVTEFHTFDNDGDAKTLGLLPLSGNVGGNRLTICKPQARNPQLDLRPVRGVFRPPLNPPTGPTTPSNTNGS
jgi:predicted nucleic acid-binding protein